MPPDRAFGRVEKKLRNIETILLSSEYVEPFASVGRVHLHGQDWVAFDFKDLVEKNLKRPLLFKIKNAKLMKINPFDRNVTICTFKMYSALGENYTILKRGKRWSNIKSHLLALESCVKPTK